MISYDFKGGLPHRFEVSVELATVISNFLVKDQHSWPNGTSYAITANGGPHIRIVWLSEASLRRIKLANQWMNQPELPDYLTPEFKEIAQQLPDFREYKGKGE